MKIMLKFCEQFGLTPSARSRIVGGDGAPDPADEMEQLLGGED
jgi:phage terminase small subunit